MKHWEFTGETMYYGNTLLHRIKATDDIVTKSGYKISSGTLGGWIETEENLKGRAWVADSAMVYGNAVVCGDAIVYDKAKVCCNPIVYGKAKVCGNAIVYGKARVYGCAKVYGDAEVYGDARVCDNAIICGNAEVYGDARVGGDVVVRGDLIVHGSSCIEKNNHWLSIGPIGSRFDTTTFTRDKSGTIFVSCGCFFGTIDEFRKEVISTHGDNKHGRVYLAAVDLAELQLDTAPIE